MRLRPRRARRWGAVTLSLGVLAAAVLAGPPGARAQQPGPGTSLKAQYDEVLGQEAGIVTRLLDAQKAAAELQSQLQDLNTKVTDASVLLLGAQGRLDRAAVVERRSRATLRAAQERLRRATDRMQRQAIDSFVNGGTTADVFQALLHTTDGGRATNTLAYAGAVVRNTTRVVEEFNRARVASDRLARQARRDTTAAQRQRDDIGKARQVITSSRDDKQRLADAVGAQALIVAQALQEVQGRKVLIEARITAAVRESDSIGLQIAAVQAGQPDFHPGDVDISTPIPGAVVVSPFGMRFHPILHISRLHAGADLGAGSGTPIHAAADGIVIIAAMHGGYGNATVIDHGHSLATLYGHQSKLLVVPGQVVKKGDIIGLVGSTGLSTGPHLHFETRIKGQPVDPVGIVKIP
ncbi:MAG: Peptidase [Acidimicrobiales bacterium]|nr:Peptidase [Acidimicrobiales bacterium]